MKIFIHILKYIGVLFLLVFIIKFAFPFFKNLYANQTAGKKIDENREQIESKTDQLFNQKINGLVSVGVIGNKIAYSKVDVCYITQSYSGWFTTNYYQDCYLRHIVGYTANFNKESTQDLVENNLNNDALFGKKSNFNKSKFADRYIECNIFEQEHTSTIIYRPKEAISDKNNLPSTNCRTPNPLQGTWTVNGPVTLDKDLSVNAYETFDTNQINDSENQVWIVQDKHYYHESLGCGPGLIFCSNPRKVPIHPDINN